MEYWSYSNICLTIFLSIYVGLVPYMHGNAVQQTIIMYQIIEIKWQIFTLAN